MSSEHLIITPSDKVEEWKNIVEEQLEKGIDIYLIGDTETTGGVMKKSNGINVMEKEDKDHMGLNHRIIEIGMIVCTFDKKTNKIDNLKDKNGNSIFFHEYINFLNEEDGKLAKYLSIRAIPDGAFFVHGISLSFLDAKSSLGEELALLKNERYRIPLPKDYDKGMRLPSSAPTFEEIIEPLKDICGLNYKHNQSSGRVTFVAHNHKFDGRFLDSEFINEGSPAFQSVTNAMDTIIIAQSLYKKEYIQNFKENKRKELEEKLIVKGYNEESIKNTIAKEIPKGIYSLDSMCYVMTEKKLMNLDGIDRTLHGAALDGEMLKRLLQGMLNSEEYSKSPNKPNPTEIKDEIIKKTNQENNLIILKNDIF
jgi:DNA polymerase III epsilon subunit-like protein